MQAFCKPARWCNSVTGDFGKCKRKWLIQKKSAAEVIEGLKEVINGLDAETKLYMRIKDWTIRSGSGNGGHKQWMKVNTWTPREWLDCLDVTATSTVNPTTGETDTEVTLDFYSTGVFPTVWIAAPCLNCLLCWVLVSSTDFQGPQPVLQPKRVATLKDLLAKWLGGDTGNLTITQLGNDNEIEQYSLLVVNAVREKMFAEGDTDHDGELDRDEAKALGMSEATFNQIDTDGDGKLTNLEVLKWQSDNVGREGGQAQGITEQPTLQNLGLGLQDV